MSLWSSFEDPTVPTTEELSSDRSRSDEDTQSTDSESSEDSSSPPTPPPSFVPYHERSYWFFRNKRTVGMQAVPGESEALAQEAEVAEAVGAAAGARVVRRSRPGWCTLHGERVLIQPHEPGADDDGTSDQQTDDRTRILTRAANLISEKRNQISYPWKKKKIEVYAKKDKFTQAKDGIFEGGTVSGKAGMRRKMPGSRGMADKRGSKKGMDDKGGAGVGKTGRLGIGGDMAAEMPGSRGMADKRASKKGMDDEGGAGVGKTGRLGIGGDMADEMPGSRGMADKRGSKKGMDDVGGAGVGKTGRLGIGGDMADDSSSRENMPGAKRGMAGKNGTAGSMANKDSIEGSMPGARKGMASKHGTGEDTDDDGRVKGGTDNEGGARGRMTGARQGPSGKHGIGEGMADKDGAGISGGKTNIADKSGARGGTGSTKAGMANANSESAAENLNRCFCAENCSNESCRKMEAALSTTYLNPPKTQRKKTFFERHFGYQKGCKCLSKTGYKSECFLCKDKKCFGKKKSCKKCCDEDDYGDPFKDPNFMQLLQDETNYHNALNNRGPIFRPTSKPTIASKPIKLPRRCQWLLGGVGKCTPCEPPNLNTSSSNKTRLEHQTKQQNEKPVANLEKRQIDGTVDTPFTDTKEEKYQGSYIENEEPYKKTKDNMKDEEKENELASKEIPCICKPLVKPEIDHDMDHDICLVCRQPVCKCQCKVDNKLTDQNLNNMDSKVKPNKIPKEKIKEDKEKTKNSESNKKVKKGKEDPTQPSKFTKDDSNPILGKDDKKLTKKDDKKKDELKKLAKGKSKIDDESGTAPKKSDNDDIREINDRNKKTNSVKNQFGKQFDIPLAENRNKIQSTKSNKSDPNSIVGTLDEKHIKHTKKDELRKPDRGKVKIDDKTKESYRDDVDGINNKKKSNVNGHTKKNATPSAKNQNKIQPTKSNKDEQKSVLGKLNKKQIKQNKKEELSKNAKVKTEKYDETGTMKTKSDKDSSHRIKDQKVTKEKIPHNQKQKINQSAKNNDIQEKDNNYKIKKDRKSPLETKQSPKNKEEFLNVPKDDNAKKQTKENQMKNNIKHDLPTKPLSRKKLKEGNETENKPQNLHRERNTPSADNNKIKNDSKECCKNMCTKIKEMGIVIIPQTYSCKNIKQIDLPDAIFQKQPESIIIEENIGLSNTIQPLLPIDKQTIEIVQDNLNNLQITKNTLSDARNLQEQYSQIQVCKMASKPLVEKIVSNSIIIKTINLDDTLRNNRLSDTNLRHFGLQIDKGSCLPVTQLKLISNIDTQTYSKGIKTIAVFADKSAEISPSKNDEETLTDLSKIFLKCIQAKTNNKKINKNSDFQAGESNQSKNSLPNKNKDNFANNNSTESSEAKRTSFKNNANIHIDDSENRNIEVKPSQKGKNLGHGTSSKTTINSKVFYNKYNSIESDRLDHYKKENLESKHVNDSLHSMTNKAKIESNANQNLHSQVINITQTNENVNIEPIKKRKNIADENKYVSNSEMLRNQILDKEESRNIEFNRFETKAEPTENSNSSPHNKENVKSKKNKNIPFFNNKKATIKINEDSIKNSQNIKDKKVNTSFKSWRNKTKASSSKTSNKSNKNKRVTNKKPDMLIRESPCCRYKETQNCCQSQGTSKQISKTNVEVSICCRDRAKLLRRNKSKVSSKHTKTYEKPYTLNQSEITSNQISRTNQSLCCRNRSKMMARPAIHPEKKPIPSSKQISTTISKYSTCCRLTNKMPDMLIRESPFCRDKETQNCCQSQGTSKQISKTNVEVSICYRDRAKLLRRNKSKVSFKHTKTYEKPYTLNQSEITSNQISRTNQSLCCRNRSKMIARPAIHPEKKPKPSSKQISTTISKYSTCCRLNIKEGAKSSTSSKIRSKPSTNKRSKKFKTTCTQSPKFVAEEWLHRVSCCRQKAKQNNINIHIVKASNLINLFKLTENNVTSITSMCKRTSLSQSSNLSKRKHKVDIVEDIHSTSTDFTGRSSAEILIKHTKQCNLESSPHEATEHSSTILQHCYSRIFYLLFRDIKLLNVTHNADAMGSYLEDISDELNHVNINHKSQKSSNNLNEDKLKKESSHRTGSGVAAVRELCARPGQHVLRAVLAHAHAQT